jgi:SAM-dependent methyltransferase
MVKFMDTLKRIYRSVKRIIKPEPIMPPVWSNWEYNKEYWNRHARSWNKYRDPIDNPEITELERTTYIKYLGDEWGRVADVQEIIADYIYPYISKESITAEIGVGGARIAAKVVERVADLHCFDISAEMLKKAKTVLSNYPHVTYVLLEHPKFPDGYEGYFDFVYSFDVFVHLNLHTIWKYFCEIEKILKSKGTAFIHTSNLGTPKGWEQFASQDRYDPQYFYFISPEIIHILAQHTNLKIIKTSCEDPNNFYLNRDYMIVLEKQV